MRQPNKLLVLSSREALLEEYRSSGQLCSAKRESHNASTSSCAGRLSSFDLKTRDSRVKQSCESSYARDRISRTDSCPSEMSHCKEELSSSVNSLKYLRAETEISKDSCLSQSDQTALRRLHRLHLQMHTYFKQSRIRILTPCSL